MIQNKFRGRLDREAIIREMTAAVRLAKAGGAQTVGVNAEDGSRTDDGFLLEFALAAKEAGADRVRYCDTIGGDTPTGSGTVRQAGQRGRPAARDALPQRPRHGRGELGRQARSAISMPVRTRGSTPASTASASGPATPTCSRRILALRHGFGVAEGEAEIGDPLDLSWARRFALWAGYALGQPLPSTRRASAATRSRTSPASTPTAR